MISEFNCICNVFTFWGRFLTCFPSADVRRVTGYACSALEVSLLFGVAVRQHWALVDVWMLGVGPASSSAVSKSSNHEKLLDIFPLIPVVSFDMNHHTLVGNMSPVHAACWRSTQQLERPFYGTDVEFKADPNGERSLIYVLSLGHGRSDPEPGTVPDQSGTTEGGRRYSTIGQPAAEGSPGHTETRLLCTADIPGLDNAHTQTHTLDRNPSSSTESFLSLS